VDGAEANLLFCTRQRKVALFFMMLVLLLGPCCSCPCSCCGCGIVLRGALADAAQPGLVRVKVYWLTQAGRRGRIATRAANTGNTGGRRVVLVMVLVLLVLVVAGVVGWEFWRCRWSMRGSGEIQWFLRLPGRRGLNSFAQHCRR
jgi:hypothetical protein